MNFGGECSDEEISRLVELAKSADLEVIVGVGGGKTLDTAKATAYELKVPVIVAPTIASTDAPCSALAVIYTPDGEFKRYLVLPSNPTVVLVDSHVVAQAPARFLVSGMGDALATYFEARSCQIKYAGNMTGRIGSMTAYALAELCYEALKHMVLKLWQHVMIMWSILLLRRSSKPTHCSAVSVLNPEGWLQRTPFTTD